MDSVQFSFVIVILVGFSLDFFLYVRVEATSESSLGFHVSFQHVTFFTFSKQTVHGWSNTSSSCSAALKFLTLSSYAFYN